MPSKIPRMFTKNLCRIIGILHGDGNMSSSRILITDKCLKYHIEEIRPLFEKVFGIKLNLFHDRNRHSYYSHIKNKNIYNFLVTKLEIPSGSIRNGLYIPKYLKDLPEKLKASYIAGLFDSESCVSKRQAEINFSTTSKDIFEFIQEYLKKNNIKFSPRIRNRRKNKEYEIYIYGESNIRNFLKLIKIRHPDKILCLQKLSLLH